MHHETVRTFQNSVVVSVLPIDGIAGIAPFSDTKKRPAEIPATWPLAEVPTDAAHVAQLRGSNRFCRLGEGREFPAQSRVLGDVGQDGHGPNANTFLFLADVFQRLYISDVHDQFRHIEAFFQHGHQIAATGEDTRLVALLCKDLLDLVNAGCIDPFKALHGCSTPFFSRPPSGPQALCPV